MESGWDRLENSCLHSDVPSYQQTGVHAVLQGRSGFAKDCLFYVEESQIQIVGISQLSEPCMVPRQVAIRGTPTKIIFSPRLEKFIILYFTKLFDKSPHESGCDLRRNQHSLEYAVVLVNLGGDFNNNPITKGRPGEKFLGVAEWLVEFDGKIYLMLIINTIIKHSPPRKSLGRILLFSVSNEGILSLQNNLDIGAPVYSLVIHDKRSVLYGCGTNLRLQYLDMTSSGCKFQDPTMVDLKSQALYLSVEKPYVYVTTI